MKSEDNMIELKALMDTLSERTNVHETFIRTFVDDSKISMNGFTKKIVKIENSITDQKHKNELALLNIETKLSDNAHQTELGFVEVNHKLSSITTIVDSWTKNKNKIFLGIIAFLVATLGTAVSVWIERVINS